MYIASMDGKRSARTKIFRFVLRKRAWLSMLLTCSITITKASILKWWSPCGGDLSRCNILTPGLSTTTRSTSTYSEGIIESMASSVIAILALKWSLFGSATKKLKSLEKVAPIRKNDERRRHAIDEISCHVRLVRRGCLETDSCGKMPTKNWMLMLVQVFLTTINILYFIVQIKSMSIVPQDVVLLCQQICERVITHCH